MDSMPHEVVLDLDSITEDPSALVQVQPSSAEARDFLLVTHDNARDDNEPLGIEAARMVGPAFRAHVLEGATMREPGVPLYDDWPLAQGQASQRPGGWAAAPRALTLGLVDPETGAVASVYFLMFLPGLDQPVSDFAWTQPEYRRRGLYRRLRLQVDFGYDAIRGGANAPGVAGALRRAGLTEEQVNARRMGPRGTYDPAAIESIADDLFRNSRAYQAERILGTDVIDQRRERMLSRILDEPQCVDEDEFERRRARLDARLLGELD